MTPADLRERRTSLGWGRNTLAKAAGVAWTTIQRIEDGKNKPNTATVHLLDTTLKREERRRARPPAGDGGEGEE